MIQRQVTSLVKDKLKRYPAVALLGPRQAGKTTLARTFSGVYFDLEQSEERLRLDLAWDELVSSNQLMVLDEAQSWPEVFPRIRGAIDQTRKRNGRFLILGSVAPALMKNASESLAGRLAICEITPFCLGEISASIQEDDLWLRGGFPDGGILKKSQFPDWQKNYLTLLAQRDLPTWGLPAKPLVTQRFFKMLAAHHGQIWNASEIAKSLGLNYHTVNSYLDYLTNAYLITVLPPYSKNLKKRVIKRPKVYWQDSGLLHYLLGAQTKNELLSQPWVGSSWEGWVIHQIVFALRSLGKPFEAYYFRTSDDYEIDLLIQFPEACWAFEAKLTSVPNQNDLRSLNKAADLIKAHKRILVSRTRHTIKSQAAVSTHIQGCLDLFGGR